MQANWDSRQKNLTLNVTHDYPLLEKGPADVSAF